MAIAHVGNTLVRNENTSDNAIAAIVSTGIAAGNIGICLVAVDNVGTISSTAAGEIASVTDDAGGNTWTEVVDARYSEGSAADGATLGIFICKVVTPITVSNLITATLNNSVAAKAMTVHNFSVGSGNDLQLAGVVQHAVHNGADPPSMTIGSLPSKEYLFVRAVAGETSATTVLTPTANYTALTGTTSVGGATAVNMAIRGEFRIVTATGDSSDPTWTATDGRDAYVAFEETSPAAPAYDQDSFRFRNDDGSETAATWVAALNTNASLNVDTNYRLRLLIQNTGTAAGVDVALTWQYNLASAGWNAITTSSSVVRAVTSANFADGDDCTQQLGSGTFYSNNDGMTEDGTAGGANLDLTNGQECETELSFQILSADVADGQTIQFRLSGLDTYTRTPVATVVEAGASPSLARGGLMMMGAGR